MKRFVFGVLVFLVSLSAAAESKRYVVVLKDRAPLAHFKAAELSEPDSFVAVESINGFVARLTDAEYERYRTSPEVLIVEPDMPRYLLQTYTPQNSVAAPQTISYGVEMVNARALWPRAKGRGVKVCIIDSGIDLTHPDLMANYKGGIDLVEKDNIPQDQLGHGTHVAGIIAARDNEIGTVGVAPEAEIYAVKMFGDKNTGSKTDLILGLDWAIRNNMQVVNMSLGDTGIAQVEELLISRAASAGIILVGASGNAGKLEILYPAAYSEVLSVGAVNRALQITNFSSYGPHMDFVAPGLFVNSTYPQGKGEAAYVRIGANTLHAFGLDYAKQGEFSGKIYDCGLGRPGQCPAAVSENIALIERGGNISFADKTRTAIAAGAKAVIVYGNWAVGAAGDPGGTLSSASPDWPIVVGLDEVGGLQLKAINDTVTVNVLSGAYSQRSGTSMAAPHIAGVVALLLEIAPWANQHAIRTALELTARNLGPPGWDITYGYGIVNALEAGNYLQKFTPRKRGARR